MPVTVAVRVEALPEGELDGERAPRRSVSTREGAAPLAVEHAAGQVAQVHRFGVDHEFTLQIADLVGVVNELLEIQIEATTERLPERPFERLGRGRWKRFVDRGRERVE